MYLKDEVQAWKWHQSIKTSEKIQSRISPFSSKNWKNGRGPYRTVVLVEKRKFKVFTMKQAQYHLIDIIYFCNSLNSKFIPWIKPPNFDHFLHNFPIWAKKVVHFDLRTITILEQMHHWFKNFLENGNRYPLIFSN